jgi:two-component system chemotaxis response regulator CheB
MSDVPTPIVIVSSLDVRSVQISMEALRSGALAVLPKPTGPSATGWTASRNTLLATVRSMSQVRLVRRWADEANEVFASGL